MRNIRNRNMAELTHCIIVFYTQKLGICFVDTGIIVWHLFSIRLLKPSLLRLIWSHVGNQGTLQFRVA